MYYIVVYLKWNSDLFHYELKMVQFEERINAEYLASEKRGIIIVGTIDTDYR